MKFSVKDSKNVKPASRPVPPSKYDPILNRIGTLKPGKTIVVELSGDVTARHLQTRLASIEAKRIQQGVLEIPKGYRIAHFATDEGLAIELRAK